MIKIYLTTQAHDQLALFQAMTSTSPYLSQAEEVSDGVVIPIAIDTHEGLLRHRLEGETFSDVIIRMVEHTTRKV